MLTSQQLDISSRFRVNQIPPLNVTSFSEQSLQGPSISFTESNLNLLTRFLMKAGKILGNQCEALSVKVPIWSNFVLAMSGAGQELVRRRAGWLAGLARASLSLS